MAWSRILSCVKNCRRSGASFAIRSLFATVRWRVGAYLPRQPEGDMSMFGWQLMAFRSAETAGITIPPEDSGTLVGFLQSRSRGRSGGLAGYREKDPPSPAMTAEALACKQLLGLRPDNPMSAEAVDYLLQNRPRRTTLNLYYWYYGTFAMFQHGGEPWKQWNNSLRDMLVNDQIRDGAMAGTWDPKGPYGRYGGRLFSRPPCRCSAWRCTTVACQCSSRWNLAIAAAET